MLSLYEISYSRRQILALGLLLLGEEVFTLLDVRFDGVTSWFPAGWADFSVLVSELKGLDQTQGLLNRASNWKVIDGDLSQDALVVNDEQTPVGDALVLLQDTVICGDGAPCVRYQGDLHGTQTALLTWCVGPCEMGVVRVNRGGDDLAANLPELFGSITESDDLGWAHKGEVQRIEEKDNVPSSVV